MDERELGTRYVLYDVIGRGAASEVLRGRDLETGTDIAVKILRPDLFSDQEIISRFVKEYLALSQIRHPNVVEVIDFTFSRRTLRIVMELVDGQDLRKYLRYHSTLTPAMTVRFGSELLAGVAAAHAADIVHRDIKPENVLISTVGGFESVKLTDFGVAHLPNSTQTLLGSSLGTPDYMAPELTRGSAASPAADVYSAGVVLYEMLAGRTPHAGFSPDHRSSPPPPIPGAPDELWQQIERLLDREPDRRPSAAEAQAEFASLVPGLDGLPALPPMGTPMPVTTTPIASGRPTILRPPYPGEEPRPAEPVGAQNHSWVPAFVGSLRSAPQPKRTRKRRRSARKPWLRTPARMLTFAAIVVAAITWTLVALLSSSSPTRSSTYKVISACSAIGTPCSLKEHSGPGYSTYPQIKSLPDNSHVEIVCQTAGEHVVDPYGGTSSVWDKLVDGGYVSDLYVSTDDSNGQFALTIPRC